MTKRILSNSGQMLFTNLQGRPFLVLDGQLAAVLTVFGAIKSILPDRFRSVCGRKGGLTRFRSLPTKCCGWTAPHPPPALTYEIPQPIAVSRGTRPRPCGGRPMPRLWAAEARLPLFFIQPCHFPLSPPQSSSRISSIG